MAKLPIVMGITLVLVGFGSGAWWYASRPAATSNDNLSIPTQPAHRDPAAGDDVSGRLNTEHKLLTEIAGLKKTLEEEIIARRRLEDIVARLEKSKPTSTSKVYTTAPEHDLQNNPPVRSETQMSFENALVAIGIDATRVTRIRHRLEQMELQQIYLRNQAEREGWISSPRYAEERRKLEDREGALRVELGDEAYDRYLYLTGEENRVAVLSVISGSAAQAAGIVAKDIIYRYDRLRIFSWSDLNRASASGRSGDTVPVEIHRNGQHLTVYIPRGPLGVRIEPQLETPTTN